MTKGRIKPYPEIWEEYKKVFDTISAAQKKWPAAKPWQEDSPRRRTAEEDELVVAYKSIISFMRKSNKRLKYATDWEIWRPSFNYAFDLANRLDINYKIWSELCWEEKEFLESFSKIISYLEQKIGAEYDSDFNLSARQLRCVLDCMRRGRATPHCPR
ncbi:hypothetical protein IKH79_00030 [Candidatus Saccharibacteria bacterium]|nr:hypothetical protein [Candidatus Saccharibacteria bacterium]